MENRIGQPSILNSPEQALKKNQQLLDRVERRLSKLMLASGRGGDRYRFDAASRPRVKSLFVSWRRRTHFSWDLKPDGFAREALFQSRIESR